MAPTLLILAPSIAIAEGRPRLAVARRTREAVERVALTLNHGRAWSICLMQQPASRDSVAEGPSERAAQRPANPRSRTRPAAARPSEPRELDAPPIGAMGAARPDREQLIATRAYALYLDRGMAHGSDVDDWLEAERQIDDEQ